MSTRSWIATLCRAGASAGSPCWETRRIPCIRLALTEHLRRFWMPRHCPPRSRCMVILCRALQAYEAERLEKTSRIVLSNREQGPEIVMQMVEDRAPNGFRNLYEVISRQELEEVSNRYKAVAGFDRDRLNSMPSS